MAVRTTSAAVELIIEVDASISLTSFIEVANNIVTKHCTDDDFTDADLELIERWLSAHFYTVRDMRAESEKAGPVTEKLQSKVDLGFSTSHYGQHAMLLDWSGALSALNEKIKKGTGLITAGVSWLGTEEEDVETD